MADTSVAITAGSGTSIDTRTEETNGNHRQVVVLGDPTTNVGVAPVDATSGLKVDLGSDNDITGTVTINNASGASAVNIQDGGNSITVDGTVAVSGTVTVGSHAVTNAGTFATQVTTVNGVAPAFGSGVRGATVQRVTVATDDSVPVTGTFWQATQPVSLASVPSHAVTNAGTFVTQENGAALTAMQLIDDTVFADDAAVTLGTSKGNVSVGVAVATDGTDPTAVSAEGDAAAFRTDMNRLLIVNQTHPRFWHVSADYASAQTNTSIKAAPGASLSLYITDIQISNGAVAGNITLLDGSAGTVLYELYPAINGGAVLSLRSPIKLTANTALCITSTTVTTHSVFVSGYIAG